MTIIAKHAHKSWGHPRNSWIGSRKGQFNNLGSKSVFEKTWTNIVDSWRVSMVVFGESSQPRKHSMKDGVLPGSTGLNSGLPGMIPEWLD
jgi:hypothetical protein